ncbi:MAG: hypothetical protein H0U88_02555 [Chthoniobacterales bacterium]|nr:hypothetical protein [Chthoniobacterales bacterium]
MNDSPPDLPALISDARRIVPDDRHIWCTASETFDSSIVQRRGLLLGGAYSPHFLRDSTAMSWDIPWAVRLRHCRVVVCDQAAHEPLAAWLPLMESVAGAGESLLVVTEAIGSELLQTFVVNAFKGTLPVCAVHPLREQQGSPTTGTRFATPPTAADQLLRIDEVWVRRTATACFPNADNPLSSAAALQNFAIIETGGENHEDQYERLRFLLRELQREAT